MSDDRIFMLLDTLRERQEAANVSQAEHNAIIRGIVESHQRLEVRVGVVEREHAMLGWKVVSALLAAGASVVGWMVSFIRGH
jgi:hypothetical protein